MVSDLSRRNSHNERGHKFMKSQKDPIENPVVEDIPEALLEAMSAGADGPV